MRRIIIIAGAVVILLIVATTVVAYISRGGNLLVTVKQQGTQIIIDGQKPVAVNSTQLFSLAKGQHSIKATKDTYEDFSTSTDIEQGQTSNITINLQQKLAPKSVSTDTINFDEQFRKQIDPNKYTITKIQYFENNTWAVAFMHLNIPQTQGIVSISKYSFDTSRWDQPVPPGEVFTNDIRKIVPLSVYNYLSASNKILKTTNP